MYAVTLLHVTPEHFGSAANSSRASTAEKLGPATPSSHSARAFVTVRPRTLTQGFCGALGYLLFHVSRELGFFLCQGMVPKPSRANKNTRKAWPRI